MMTDGFHPIDLDQHFATCLRFRYETFVTSGGNSSFFGPEGQGSSEYEAFLRAFIARDAWSCVHLWRDGAIIGQMEMGPYKHDPSIGHVNLVYLIPEWRGKGIAGQLDPYAVSYFRKLGIDTLQLCVSESNAIALRYYAKHGWVDAGPRTDRIGVRFMRKAIFP